MQQPLIRIATIVGMFCIIAAGVVTGVRASADSVEVIGSREYGCHEGAYRGAIIVRFAKPGPDAPSQSDRIAGIYYRIGHPRGVLHELSKTFPLVPDGNKANVWVVDQAAKPGPRTFRTDNGKQDGGIHPLGGDYYREHAYGPFRFMFRFDQGGATPDVQDCTVELSDLVPDRGVSSMVIPTYTCELDGFTGTIGIHHEVRNLPNPTHVITKVEYKVDEGENSGGDEANVHLEDSYTHTLAAFETDGGGQDNQWHPFPQSPQEYTRGPATSDSPTHEVTLEFVFDLRGQRDPKCKVILPDLP